MSQFSFDSRVIVKNILPRVRAISFRKPGILFFGPSIFLVMILLTSSPTFAKTLCSKYLSASRNKQSTGLGTAAERGNHFVKFDPKTLEFSGLTDEGLEAFRQARYNIRMRAKLFDTEFKDLETLHHAGLIARLFKGNMFLYGPPTGAQSAFVNWMMRGESVSPYKLQLHQMLTEQVFTGGQNFGNPENERFEVIIKGHSSNFSAALIDAVEKENPGMLPSLVSRFNRQKFSAGIHVIKAKLETVFATSNVNFPKMLLKFSKNDRRSTAPTFLSSFQFKAFICNCLSPRDQAVVDQRSQRRRRLKSLAEINPGVLKDEVFLKPKPLDWNSIRLLANALFEPSPHFTKFYGKFVKDMKKQTNRAIRKSKMRHRQNYQNEPFVYFPSADYTQRLVKQIPEIILISAFIDFMMSPLANDVRLAHFIKNKIQLDPLSLWRASLVMTTIGPGHTHLVFDPTAEQKIDMRFNWPINLSPPRDRAEELHIQNIKAEQERFRRTFLKHLASMQDQIEFRAKNGSKEQTSPLEEPSFELRMLRPFGN